MGKNKYPCRCRCNRCRSTPGSRRVECDCCGHLVGPGCCLAVEGAHLRICHVCNRDFQSRSEGLYMHWQLGRMWDAYVCFVVLFTILSRKEPEPEPWCYREWLMGGGAHGFYEVHKCVTRSTVYYFWGLARYHRKPQPGAGWLLHQNFPKWNIGWSTRFIYIHSGVRLSSYIWTGSVNLPEGAQDVL